MPKPKRRASASKGRAPLLLGALAALALIVFIGGELLAFLASDLGRLMIYRHLHLGDRARVVRNIGRRIHEGLTQARVPRDRVHEEIVAGPEGGLPRWRVDLPEDGSPLQVNYAITHAVEKGGGVVLSGRESPGREGALAVTLEVGLPGRRTHEVVIERPGRAGAGEEAAPRARVAVVLFGLGDDPALTRRMLARREPFAHAVPAAGEGHDELRALARASGHELVLQVPMEPENFPRVNPGPGALLVNMPPHRIRRLTHDYLAEAGDVVAVANLMGSFATQDEPFMTAFFLELRRAGVPFLHVAPVARAVCRPLAARIGVAYDEPDALLDGEARAKNAKALERSWRHALGRAEENGQAVVLLRVTPTSAAWLERALTPKALGSAMLVPLSGVIHRAGAR